MDDEPNYARRLALIMGCFFVGFSLIVLDGWTLLHNPGQDETWLILILRWLPIALGVGVLLTGFFLLRTPVPKDPALPPDDIENIDGA